MSPCRSHDTRRQIMLFFCSEAVDKHERSLCDEWSQCVLDNLQFCGLQHVVFDKHSKSYVMTLTYYIRFNGKILLCSLVKN